MNMLEQVTITTETWMKNPIASRQGFTIDAEFWRKTPEDKWEFKTYEAITPKTFTRLVRTLVDPKSEFVSSSDRMNVYYGEKYDTASVTIEFNR